MRPLNNRWTAGESSKERHALGAEKRVPMLVKFCRYLLSHAVHAMLSFSLASGLLLSACLSIETAVDKAIGPVMEIWLSRVNWTTEGCMMRVTVINVSNLRTLEPFIQVTMEDGAGGTLSAHELAMTKLRPEGEQTIDISLDIDSCNRMTSIHVTRACNVATGSFCSVETCQFADRCNLISPNGLPYAGSKIDVVEINDLPSLVRLEVHELGLVVEGYIHPYDPKEQLPAIGSWPEK